MNQELNYPDVLGYITGDTRMNVNVLQIAAALSPRVVRSGRPLEMHLLMQNASDVELEVVVTLRLPERDAKKQKGRFVTKADRLRIGLQPAGVGCVVLPVSTLPDTAVGAGYKIGMDVKMKPVQRGKANRVRDTHGGTVFDPKTVSDDVQAKIATLRELSWVIDSPTLRNSSIEASLSVMSGKVGSFADLEPSWTSLWTLKDLADDLALLKQLAPAFKKQVLPKLEHKHAFPLLLDATRNYFKKSKYRISDFEIETITRLVYAPLRYAGEDPRKMVLSRNQRYNLTHYLADGYTHNEVTPLDLPDWFSQFLRLMNIDERVTRNPVKGLIHLMYEVLLRDALGMGLHQVAALAEVDMGSADERAQYVDFVMEHIKNGNLNFDLLYVPAVVGGVAVADEVLGRDEHAADLAHAFRDMLEKRKREVNEDNETTYKIAHQIIEIFAEKFIAR